MSDLLRRLNWALIGLCLAVGGFWVGVIYAAFRAAADFR